MTSCVNGLRPPGDFPCVTADLASIVYVVRQRQILWLSLHDLLLIGQNLQ